MHTHIQASPVSMCYVYEYDDTCVAWSGLSCICVLILLYISVLMLPYIRIYSGIWLLQAH
jgi:hypothetical protein